MWGLIVLGLLFFFTVATYLMQHWNSSKNLPGPWGLPLLGYAPFLGKDPLEAYDNLAKKYGPIFTMKMGTQKWVVLNNRQLIREAFGEKKIATSDRPQNATMQALAQDLVTTFSNGPPWKCQREFVIKTLKSFGKKAMEECILEEAVFLCEALEQKMGEAFECQRIISKAVANVVFRVFMSKRFSYDDENFKKSMSVLTHSVSGGERNSNDFGALFAAPFLRHFPYYKEVFKKTLSSFEFFRGEIRKVIEEHDTPSDEKYPRDFTDEFRLEMKKETKDPSFTKDRLVFSLQDFLVAGSETTTNTLRWSLLALVIFPQYQEKIWQEIKNVAGRNKKVTMEHREKMHLTAAFLQEISRHRPPVPHGVPHATSSEIVLAGYRIPTKTTIIANIWTVHHSTDYFSEPHKFRPERFLDEQGHFVPSENVIPFSFGSRRCIGEQLARIELFLLLTTIVQSFEISADHTKGPSSLDDGVLALTYAPRECFVKFQKRLDSPGDH